MESQKMSRDAAKIIMEVIKETSQSRMTSDKNPTIVYLGKRI